MKKILELSKSVSKHCVGFEGNVSSKYKNGLIIKASGTRLESLTKKDLVFFDFKGNQLNNFKKRGSMELSFHTYLLSFDDINYVSHTHPSNTVKILCSELSETFAQNRLFPDQVIFNGPKSCFVPYAKPGEELTNVIKDYINLFIKEEKYFPKLILLQNHGIICCGETIQECIMSTDICEKSAEIFIGSHFLGKTHFLNETEVNNLITDKKEIYRQNLIKQNGNK
jgi:L-fuculose-phosphate aldolase